MLSKGAYRAARERLQAKLRAARAEEGLSQVRVAQLLGKPQSFISKIEAGEREVSFLELQVLAKIYRRPLSHFEDDTLTSN